MNEVCNIPVFFDIETIPDQRTEALDDILETLKPPASMKKPETIKKWWEEKAYDVAQEKLLKTSFDGGRGKIICACVAVAEGAVVKLYGDNEQDIIAGLFQHVKSQLGHNQPLWVGHNIKGFDLPFLFKRCVLNDMKPQVNLDAGNRYSRLHYDTMTEWAGFTDRISLDELCKILSVPTPKDNMHGSEVYQAWQDGRIEDIATYCAGDVEAVRNVYNRMTFNNY